MLININELVNNKIKELEESKKIEKTIEEVLEKTILEAVADAIKSYELKRNIRDKMTKQISEVVKDIGFEGYNSFIVEKLKQIIDGTCKKDFEEKIQESFKELLMVKHESIKLSKIFETYREWISNHLDEDEKNYDGFYASMEKSSYSWYTIILAKEKPLSYSRKDSIEFTVHIRNNGEGWIGTIYLNGVDIEESIPFGYLTKFESFLINLKYNKTPIIIDVEAEDDIDTSYIGYEDY